MSLSVLIQIGLLFVWAGIAVICFRGIWPRRPGLWTLWLYGAVVYVALVIADAYSLLVPRDLRSPYARSLSLSVLLGEALFTVLLISIVHRLEKAAAAAAAAAADIPPEGTP